MTENHHLRTLDVRQHTRCRWSAGFAWAADAPSTLRAQNGGRVVDRLAEPAPVHGLNVARVRDATALLPGAARRRRRGRAFHERHRPTRTAAVRGPAVTPRLHCRFGRRRANHHPVLDAVELVDSVLVSASGPVLDSGSWDAEMAERSSPVSVRPTATTVFAVDARPSDIEAASPPVIPMRSSATLPNLA